MYETSCSISNEPDGMKRTIKYDLIYSSFPWILVIFMKSGKHCDQISDLQSEVQVIRVKIVLLLRFGGQKTHFVSISVDPDRENNIFMMGWIHCECLFFITMNFSHQLQNLEVQFNCDMQTR